MIHFVSTGLNYAKGNMAVVSTFVIRYIYATEIFGENFYEDPETELSRSTQLLRRIAIPGIFCGLAWLGEILWDFFAKSKGESVSHEAKPGDITSHDPPLLRSRRARSHSN